MARILIIEDDDGVAALFALVLQEAGHHTDRVVRARDAATALAEHEPYDLVLLDLTLAGQRSGTETAEMIRRLGYQMPIIVTTGGAVPEDKPQDPEALGRVRFAATLYKPITLDALLAEVARQLRG